MTGLRRLGQGLVLSVLAISTLLGALLIAAHESFAGPIGLVSPTEIAAVTPGLDDIPTLTPTPAPNPSITATPTPEPFVCATPSGAWRAIEFRPLDDSLIVIAQTFHISLQQLIEVNCLDRRPQLSWQSLYVPAPTAIAGATLTLTAVPTLVACLPRFDGLPYIVRPGDTLSSIAFAFRVSLNDLLVYNCFSYNTLLIAGTAIMLPPYASRITPFPSPTFVLPTWTFTPSPTSVVSSPTPTDTPTATPTTETPPIITETFTPTPTEIPPTWTDTPTPTATQPLTPTDTPTLEPTATATTASSPISTPLAPDTLPPSHAR